VARERPFLTAQWRHLVMLNWRVGADLLAPHLPPGTELDPWEGDHWLSIVGLVFLDTRILGFGVPFHRDFEEVNLRLYTRRKEGAEWRHGVTFVKEIVPRRAVAALARLSYGEPYVRRPMSHAIEGRAGRSGPPDGVRYNWTEHGAESGRVQAFGIRPTPGAGFQVPGEGTHGFFISEHFWGYGTGRGGELVEYRVEHPGWGVVEGEPKMDMEPRATYGEHFQAALSPAPDTCFLAEGSEVEVLPPRRIKA